jgi:hypothetical protein
MFKSMILSSCSTGLETPFALGLYKMEDKSNPLAL